MDKDVTNLNGVEGQDTENMLPEFEGIDPEIIKEILAAENIGETETATAEADSEEAHSEEGQAEGENTVENDAEQAQQEIVEQEEAPQKTVPYAALKEEREKRKAAAKQVEDLQRMLAQYQQNTFQNQAKPKAEEVPTTEAKSVDEILMDMALENVTEALKAKGAELDPFDPKHSAMVAREAIRLEQMYTSAAAEQQQQKILFQDYQTFVVQQQSMPEYTEAVEQVREQIASMPVYQKAWLQQVYTKCEQGSASQEEYAVIKSLFEDAKNKVAAKKAKAAVATKPPVQKPVESKIAQIAQFPKGVGDIGASDQQNVYNDVEYIKNNWDSLPQEVKDKILRGG